MGQVTRKFHQKVLGKLPLPILLSSTEKLAVTKLKIKHNASLKFNQSENFKQ